MGFEEQQRCMGCMMPLAWDGRCSCGFDRKSYLPDSHYLPPGSFLKNGDYMVGKVLGEGGFGITYIGFDQNLLSRIAIKEYYPAGFAGRDISSGNHDVCAYGGDAAEVYRKGLDAFLKEARMLTRFSAMEGIVKVRNLFEENKTAYIVMEYVEGVSVKKYVQRNGKIAPEQVLKMMEQPIQALQAVHEENLVHRDVSADNLMIGQNGKITLIDFGAARSSNVMDEKTRTTICKQGFSALEQYSKEGKQGPWTDVYSICATMYYMLTGIVPKNSTERIVDDMVVPLNQMDDILLAQDKKEAIMTGMKVKSSERFQNMKMLYSALYGESYKDKGGAETDFVIPKVQEPDMPAGKRELESKTGGITALLGEVLQELRGKRSRRKRKKLLRGIAGTVVIAVFLALVLWNTRGFLFTKDAGVKEQAAQTQAKPTDVPKPTKTPKLTGTPEPTGTSKPSEPPDVVKMPKVNGMKKAAAIERIKKKGFRYRVIMRNSNTIAAGTVIRANISAGTTVKKGKTIVLFVSRGKKVTATSKPTATPRPTAPKKTTKKTNKKKDGSLAGDLDTILY